MSEPIKVGDLVVIVRGHQCVVARLGGIPFTVTHIVEPTHGGYRCPSCWEHSLAPTELAAGGLRSGCATPLSWLKRIPPLTEPETVEQRDKVTA